MAKRTTGFDSFRSTIRGLRGRLPDEIRDELVKSAERVRTNVVADIRIQKIPADFKGSRRGGPGRRKHIPSPPYGPPNSDTGRLTGSYTTDSGTAGNMIFARVVAGVRYALWLETGTKRMLKRPHLLPRFREEVTKLRGRLQKLTKGPS